MSVLSFSPKGEPLMRYPAGVPSSLDTDPIIIDSAADAVAVLAGLQWDAMTPIDRETARAFATLAAVALHPEGLCFLAYAMHAQLGLQPFDQPPVVRRMHVSDLMTALTAAANRVIGVANPTTSEALAALMRTDLEATRGRW